MYKRLTLLAVLVAPCLLSACVATEPYRVNPRFRQQSERMQTVTVLPADVKVYQIDAGGIREPMEEWCSQAKNNILRAVQNQLSTKMGTKVDVLTEELLDQNKSRWEETVALYRAVAAMVFLHTYQNPNIPNHYFEEKLKNFDYSLGSDVQGLAPGASMLLFLDAEDHIWTGGRRVLQGLGAILGIAAGVATGVVIIPYMGGGTTVQAALVDSATGDILWINAVRAGAGTDLRDATSATTMVNDLFKDFPPAHDSQSE
jgi:hypothetical protein